MQCRSEENGAKMFEFLQWQKVCKCTLKLSYRPEKIWYIDTDEYYKL